MSELGAIDFILFTVKETDDQIVDVSIDLKVREFKLEKIDLYGQTLEPEIGGRLRRKSVERFLVDLETMDLIAYPVKEKNTLPLNLKSATLMYRLNDQSYFTDGDQENGLAKVHKKIEQLVNTTFGSYAFYD